MLKEERFASLSRLGVASVADSAQVEHVGATVFTRSSDLAGYLWLLRVLLRRSEIGSVPVD